MIDETTIHIYSATQWLWVMRPMQVGGGLSLLGSFTIIFILLRSGTPSNATSIYSKIHNRILFVMSIVDCFNSIALILGTVPVPYKFKDIIYGAMGNNTSCFTQAVVIHLSANIIPSYNAVLNLYYLAIIKYDMSGESMKIYEPYVHLIVITIPVVIAAIGGSANVYSPSIREPFCGINTCDFQQNFGNDYDSYCTSHSNYSVVILYEMVTAQLLILLFIIYSMREITLVVKLQQDETTAEKKSSGLLRRGKASSTIQEERQNQYNETYIQACLYVGAYFLTFFYSCMDLIFGFTKMDSWIHVGVCGFLYSLQGFWNCVAFIRPRYMLMRNRMKTAPFTKVLKCAILRPYIFFDLPNTDSFSVHISASVQSPTYQEVASFSRRLSYPSNFSNPRSAGDDVFALSAIGSGSRGSDLSGFTGVEGSFSNTGYRLSVGMSSNRPTGELESLLPQDNRCTNYLTMRGESTTEDLETSETVESLHVTEEERTNRSYADNGLPASRTSDSPVGIRNKQQLPLRLNSRRRNLTMLVAQDILTNDVTMNEQLHTTEEVEERPPSEIIIENSSDGSN